MSAPASVFWLTALGCCFLIAGIFTYRRELFAKQPGYALWLVAMGPTFLAAPLATFAAEHFTAPRTIAQLVPRWMPAHLFITYFVGVALLAAALSFVARRCIRWAAILLAIMFALFVLLMDLPASLKHPEIHLYWSLAARQATFSMGALALFATEVRDRWPTLSNRLASIARVWAGLVLIFYGIEHLLYPQYSPGVPSTIVTAPWVPLPQVISYVTGALLIAFGVAMLVRKYASTACASAGLLMTLLTGALYVPNLFLAHNDSQRVLAINFIFDTLLFAGTLLVITRVIFDSKVKSILVSQAVIQSC